MEGDTQGVKEDVVSPLSLKPEEPVDTTANHQPLSRDDSRPPSPPPPSSTLSAPHLGAPVSGSLLTDPNDTALYPSVPPPIPSEASGTLAAPTLSTITPSKPAAPRTSSNFSTTSAGGTYHSTRPAPPSPAPSRRASAVYTPSSAGFRDRASSTASSSNTSASHTPYPSIGAGGAGSGGLTPRGPSASGGSPLGSPALGPDLGGAAFRRSSKVRPRSSLGTSFLTANQANDVEHQGEPSPAVTMSEKEAAAVSPQSRAQIPTHVAPDSAAPTVSPKSGDEDPEALQAAGSTGGSTPTPSQPFIIRDYAYPTSDDRYRGIPAPISRRESGSPGYGLGMGLGWRRPSTEDSVPATAPVNDTGAYGFGYPERKMSDSNADAESSSSGKKGWPSLGLLGWRGFLTRRRSSQQPDTAASVAPNHSHPDNLDPTSGGTLDDQVDLRPDDYAFESSSSDEDDASGRGGRAKRSSDKAAMGQVERDEFDEEDMLDDEEEEEDEEPYGLYRAVYAFEAEGEHEISVAEGQVVHVKGRGGGEGWVIAVRSEHHEVPLPTAGREGRIVEGLVPESYLERAHSAISPFTPAYNLDHGLDQHRRAGRDGNGDGDDEEDEDDSEALVMTSSSGSIRDSKASVRSGSGSSSRSRSGSVPPVSATGEGTKRVLEDIQEAPATTAP